MKTIKQLLLEMTAVQSDTGTKMECAMADKLTELIGEIPYFQDHPEQAGQAWIEDPLSRPVVWALKKGSSNKTLILMGHYDAVDLGTYGELAPYALDPEELRRQWLKQDATGSELKADLENPLWLFGRGVADMKAGVAINLNAVAEMDNKDVNILFLGVPDEENMSQGARMCADVLLDLAGRFGLAYRMCIISEPSFRSVEKSQPLRVTCGSTGKLLPVVVVRGKLVHAARMLSGLNAAAVLAGVTAKLELNENFVSLDQGHRTQPPTVQYMRDLKSKYDVSVPEYAAACYNLLFLKSRKPAELLEIISGLVEESYNEVLKKRHGLLPVYEGSGETLESIDMEPLVLSLKELLTLVEKNKADFPRFHRQQVEELAREIEQGTLSLPEAGIRYIRALMEFSEIEGPLAVVGIAPPYYPPYHISCVDDREAKEILSGLGLEEIPYTAGMTDLSYTCCADPQGETSFMENVVLSDSLYKIPFDSIGRLNVPSVMIGPAGKSVHQKGERVYLPDVTENISQLFQRIVDNMAERL